EITRVRAGTPLAAASGNTSGERRGNLRKAWKTCGAGWGENITGPASQERPDGKGARDGGRGTAGCARLRVRIPARANPWETTGRLAVSRRRSRRETSRPRTQPFLRRSTFLTACLVTMTPFVPRGLTGT